jgi:translation initiation factor 1
MTSRDREALLKRLKTYLGTGGAIKVAAFEIQGDHRDAIMTFLEGLGYRPKRTGG